MTYRNKSLESELEELKARVKTLEESVTKKEIKDNRSQFDGVGILLEKAHYQTKDFSYGAKSCPFCHNNYRKWWQIGKEDNINVGRLLSIKDANLWEQMKMKGIAAIFERKCVNCNTHWYVHQKENQ